MKNASLSQVQELFLNLKKRSETNSADTLYKTFVDDGVMVPMLLTQDHQVIFGRRGTGKTHALKFIEQRVGLTTDIPIYADLRNIGSAGSIYGDPEIPLPERGTRLLIDVLTIVSNILAEHAIKVANEDPSKFDRLAAIVDNFASEITSTKVIGPTTVIKTDNNAKGFSLGGTISPSHLSTTAKATNSQNSSVRTEVAGRRSVTIQYGAISAIIDDYIKASQVGRIWILLDEWASLPPDLQPLLADLLRRALFPIQKLTVKIAAIEYRSHFSLHADSGPIGIELGADASADLDFDDFMVFDNDGVRARNFFSQLIWKHVMALANQNDVVLGVKNADELIQMTFTQSDTFDELVRAAEGVPRDAINILSLATQKAFNGKISVNHIRNAVRTWYQRDKETAISSDKTARDLLRWIIEEVIRSRRARAFLLRADVKDETINKLFDSRVLHILKRTISSKDHPGVRFRIYGLDYGCYVDLMSTKHAPTALLLSDDENDPQVGVGNVEVPKEDLRSIRRSILELDRFKDQQKNSELSEA